MLLDQRLRLFAIARLGNDLQIVGALDQLPHSSTDDVVIVCQDHTNFIFGFGGWFRHFLFTL
jgi:hypothetical protein